MPTLIHPILHLHEYLNDKAARSEHHMLFTKHANKGHYPCDSQLNAEQILPDAFLEDRPTKIVLHLSQTLRNLENPIYS